MSFEDIYFTIDPADFVPNYVILTEQVVTSGGGGGGSGTDDRVDLQSGTSTYPLISVTKATVSGVSGVVWKYDDGSQDGLSLFVADGTGLNAVKSAIEEELPLIGTYTESGTTVVGTSVTISLTYAQITAAVAAGRPVFLTDSTKSRYFAYVGTHAVNGTTSHVFSVAECSVNGDTLAKSGSMRTIVYPSSGTAYMYSMAVSSTITASDTNPVNSVAVIAYINSLDASNVGY